jgi:hypothetical protein
VKRVAAARTPAERLELIRTYLLDLLPADLQAEVRIRAAGREPPSWEHRRRAGAPEGLGSYGGYQDLIFAHDPAPGEQAGRRQLLQQYFGLDTIGMLAIWRHWLGRAAPPS